MGREHPRRNVKLIKQHLSRCMTFCYIAKAAMLNNAHINQSTDLSKLPSKKEENRRLPCVYEELPNHLSSYGLKTPWWIESTETSGDQFLVFRRILKSGLKVFLEKWKVKRRNKAEVLVHRTQIIEHLIMIENKSLFHKH
jgi:hypothetical protein